MVVVAFLSLFDVSRVYHYIRGQNAIKHYVLFNMLEVFIQLKKKQKKKHDFNNYLVQNNKTIFIIIFKIIEVCEKLISSAGPDVMEGLYRQTVTFPTHQSSWFMLKAFLYATIYSGDLELDAKKSYIQGKKEII